MTNQIINTSTAIPYLHNLVNCNLHYLLNDFDNMTINNFHDEYINTRNFYPFNLSKHPSEDDIIKMDHIKNIYDNFYDEIFIETKKNLYYEISKNIYELISKDIHERYNINYSYNIDMYMHGFEHYSNLEYEIETNEHEIESDEDETNEDETNEDETNEDETNEDETNQDKTGEIESYENQFDEDETEEIESDEDEIEYEVHDVKLNEDDVEYEYEVHDLEDSEYLKKKKTEF